VSGRLRIATVVAVGAAALGATSLGGAAAFSPTFRMAIVHFVHGCHVWSLGNKPAAKITLKLGTKLAIRDSCPMDFRFVELAGPKLQLGDPLTHQGTVRTIVFRKRGLYKLQATNVQSSEQQGLQTLGPDNVLALTVVVK
jgi:hypothetical protein